MTLIPTTESVSIYFYKFIVNHQVFFKSKYTYALVNLKPIVPGHVLIVPLRTNVIRLSDLTPIESIDYMNTLQLIHRFIIDHYKADSLNIAIQDGPESGQSIPHLHTHIIPRYKLDGIDDGIHNQIESMDLIKQFEQRKQSFLTAKEKGLLLKVPHDNDRISRTDEVMKVEADGLREKLNNFIKQNDIVIDQ
ncbi:hypothetical protein DFJ63DRAFT_283353 [Scheffersomyces coipomensis]|uniref:uncharacterized protein n=1 Tax=Scheffersomyces coipomensis TaxID=1788519 RepID=UPI00315D37D8